MRAFLHNITTAINDPDLIGESLMTPVSKCINGYKYFFSDFDPRQEICQRISEVFYRSMICLVTNLVVIPSVVLGSFGAVLKLADLYRRFDEKVSLNSEISDYLPLILKPFSRTGDCTASYLRARIIADDAGMPLYYKPFKGSEIFAFDKLEKNRKPKYYRNIVYLKTPEQIRSLQTADKTQSTLYLVPFAPFNRDLDKESETCSFPKYHPDWTQYQDRLRQLLQVESEKIDLPEDSYKIALHIRDGGTYDDNNTKTLHPLKLPSLNFYIGELNRVIRMKKQEGQSSFFIHIFTDALNPEEIRNQISRQVNVEEAQIVFSFTPREQTTLRYDAGNMGRFQCMIRADSNLSGPIVSASDTELDIFPSGFDVKGRKIVISEVTRKRKGADKIKENTSYSKTMKGWLPNWFNHFFYRYFGVHKS